MQFSHFADGETEANDGKWLVQGKPLLVAVLNLNSIYLIP